MTDNSFGGYVRAGLSAIAICLFESGVAAQIFVDPPQAGLGCTIAPAAVVGANESFQLGSVWTGVGTGIGAAALPNGSVLAAYYDPERWVTLVSFDPKRHIVCRHRLSSRFDGWDAHNSLAIAIASDGTLHVAGNAHASPLFYARGRADDVATVVPANMIGRDENSVTYPSFMKDAQGRLLFLYRAGAPGRGTWIFNRWDNGRWSRMGSLFADHDGIKPVSGYPTRIIWGSDGYAHVAVVWRRTADVVDNYAITYARTHNFVDWETSAGHHIRIPLTPGSMESIETPGSSAGLVNGPQIIVTDDARPIVVYPRTGLKGTDAIIAATPASGNWRKVEIATSNQYTLVQGKGALPWLPSVTIGNTTNDSAELRITFPPNDRRRVRLDLKSLEVKPTSNIVAAAPQPYFIESLIRKMADAYLRVSRVSLYGLDRSYVGTLEWVAQSANGDQPRACSIEHPTACKPPASPLIWRPTRDNLLPKK